MTPITIVSGTLGAGKTTIILNLIKELPESYKSVWLKNEYGDLDIDTKLINQSNIKTKEILNGCLCCVLIGRLKDAIEEITKNYSPDRIIIETAGTAYPFPILEEVQKIDDVFIDGFINVIDVLNFEKLADKSALAKAQAKYFDLIIFNKQELAEAEQIEKVEDEVFEIYSNIPKVKSEKGYVSKDILFGLDRKIVGINKADTISLGHSHEDIEAFNVTLNNSLTRIQFEEVIKNLNPSDFYRIKGIINLDSKNYLFNYVLGRFTFEEFKLETKSSDLVFIGSIGIKNLKSQIERKLAS